MDNITNNNWNIWYKKICKDFNFSEDDDKYSADILNNLIKKYGKFNKSHLHVHNKCIVFGAGPSIKKHIQLIKNNFNLNNYTLIAADGATTALLEENIIPSIIVTDLDGNIDSILKSNKRGSILYVHAHGDNVNKIKKYVPKLKNIIPTTQTKPYDLLENHGGFTDGDRAVHIALYDLKIKDITLAGMDFGNIITNYSRPEIEVELKEANDIKKLKLVYAKKLIESLKLENENIKINNLIK